MELVVLSLYRFLHAIDLLSGLCYHTTPCILQNYCQSVLLPNYFLHVLEFVSIVSHHFLHVRVTIGIMLRHNFLHDRYFKHCATIQLSSCHSCWQLLSLNHCLHVKVIVSTVNKSLSAYHITVSSLLFLPTPESHIKHIHPQEREEQGRKERDTGKRKTRKSKQASA